MTNKIDTVQDDENGSFEGRLAIIDQAMFSIPVASTIFLQTILEAVDLSAPVRRLPALRWG